MAKRRKRDLQQLRDANERLMDWQGMENVPNDVKMYRDMLADFYKSIGKKVAHPELFSTRVNLTRKQQETLNDISFQVLNKWTTDLSNYENFLVDETRSDVRDRYDVKTLSDAVTFLNDMETSRNEAWIADILSSDQIRELYEEARDNGLTTDEANDLIYIEYSANGSDDPSWIYDQIWDSIQQYGEKYGEKKWKW
jgi:hypothetical protein